ncbi:MAG TPA: phosphoribosylglycinamide formyltransferase [Planctomycetes bacterium]|nr:phosphoribosylglycinamide formyltransferase [Fuerstiella sp.]HIK94825.1 phosphoribosylglycinamide formyltransferase [Planctomycetota bacterium]
MDRPVRLGVLISGGGTTLLNFLDCIQEGLMNAEVPLVVASRPDCKGVQRAVDAGLDCITICRRDFAGIKEFSDAVFGALRTKQVDLVTLAGYLSLLHIPDDFRHRVLNIHPALIPAFSGKGMYGHHVHDAVVARGAKVSGCTVHLADNEYDQGPIVLQSSVEIPDEATAQDVAALVFDREKIAYPEAIRRVTSGHLHLDGRRTRLVFPDAAAAKQPNTP